MATTAQFVATPVTGRVRLSAGNTGRDGSGTISTLVTGSANGTRIEKVTFVAAGTMVANSANIGRVWISDTSGANWRLYSEVAISVVTPSASAIGAKQQIVFSGGLIIPLNIQLGVTVHTGDAAGNQFDVIAEGGNF